MNTYDPATLIRYVHVGRGTDPTPADSDRACTRLPSGYANRSPRTYLGSAGRAGGCGSRRRQEQNGRWASVQPLGRETSLPTGRAACAERRPG